MASVSLRSVKKVYEGGVTAVHSFDLDIKDKEFAVLVGPSGCGKSTTLRMIAGLEEVTEGNISIDNKVVNDVPPKDRDIAMVFQNYALYPHMTVYENMAFGLKLRKFPRTEIEQRVREAASVLAIEDLLPRKPKALSGGQRQRVALGRAIVRKPKVFLFDEPLSNLDAKLRVQMRTEISKLHQRLGATMIYVTHDQTEAMTMGDRIVLMKDGYVQQVDSPLEIYTSPVNKFVAGFIGSPAMNFFRGMLGDGKRLRFREQPHGIDVAIEPKDQKRLKKFAGKEILLGMRPEHIYETGQGRKAGAKVSVLVSVVEPMGNEYYVYFNTGDKDSQYVARISSAKKPTIGRQIDLVFDMAKAHFFDPMSEQSI